MPFTGKDCRLTISPSGLIDPRRALVVVNYSARYYKRIAETVLRWFAELEDGIIQSDNGPVFDARILDYRLDVQRVLDSFPEAEQHAILLVHRDGCSAAEAVQLAGLHAERPHLLVADIEARMGRVFDRHKLGDFLDYVGYLR